MVGMNKSNTKSKTSYEGEKTEPLGTDGDSCSQNQLDIADFLIDGLTSRRASGAGFM